VTLTTQKPSFSFSQQKQVSLPPSLMAGTVHANIFKLRFCQAGLTRKACLEEYVNKSLKHAPLLPYGPLEAENTGSNSSGRLD
jgi:hypothetical protein